MMAFSTDTFPVAAEPKLFTRLRDHFGTDPGQLPVVEQSFQMYERPNLHLAVEKMLAEPGRDPSLIGIIVGQQFHVVSLSQLSRPQSAAGLDEGPVEYMDVDLAGGRRLACLKRALYLFRDRESPAALLISDGSVFQPGIAIEVMAGDREAGQRILRRIVRDTRHGNAFRGSVLSVAQDCRGTTTVQFHTLPAVEPSGLILPPQLLQRIERHAVGFTRHAEKLRAAGRHAKRGILLHGRPGTGKTLTAMFLAGRMPGRTVLILTGAAVNAIETVCALARLLEPATVILEDVDLIGTQRENQSVGANALLFELLNQMDGLGEDADILFVLTTNRPDVLEPALASRPGRIDLAVEVPLPDADGRRRMFDLYARGLRLEVSDMDRLVARTAGVSGAFIRELLRKAAVLAAEEDGDGELVVRDAHLDEAVAELLVAGGPLTQTLLGATQARASDE
jgi:cell division protease FtsH